MNKRRILPEGVEWITVERPAGLSQREIDTLRAIGSGLTLAAAGKKLGLSNKTIETHWYSARKKIAKTLHRDNVSYAVTFNFLVNHRIIFRARIRNARIAPS